MTLDEVEARLAPHRLTVMGGFAPTAEDDLPHGTRSLLLIGPAEPGFWPHLTGQPEWLDGKPDPVDRWSRRVIGRIACDLRGKALFPFGGPPWRPFYAWALRTGRVWESPVRLLVHDRAGLWTSFRGALALKQVIAMPPPGDRPCADCRDTPCLTACRAGALTGRGYDVPRCHDWLDDRAAGAECQDGGCLVRRACPLSQSHGRMAEQSAYHMSRFHP